MIQKAGREDLPVYFPRTCADSFLRYPLIPFILKVTRVIGNICT